MLVDLHLHTSCSDGVWAPERLYAEIRARELELFCVSDHDNLDAYPVPPDLVPRSIPGLEVDSHHAGHTAHLLAYGVSDRSSPLLCALTEQLQARRERMKVMIDRCNDLGLDICMADVQAQSVGASSLGRPHLARALLEKGLVDSVQDAFDRFLSDDGTGYVALERLSSSVAIELIHASGGVAIVAHPKRLRKPEHLDELVALGADGVEIFHPTADTADQARFSLFAAERDLLTTGGTDFHAPVAGRELGIHIDPSATERLIEKIQRNLHRIGEANVRHNSHV
jgi:predicted metal-dependent phosphoesterase TrpH